MIECSKKVSIKYNKSKFLYVNKTNYIISCCRSLAVDNTFVFFDESQPWRKHPWNAGGQVELIPVSFLLSLCHQSPTDSTDLCSGEIVPVDDVWDNIVRRDG